MPRAFFLALLLGVACLAGQCLHAAPPPDPVTPFPSPKVDFDHLPWKDGEALTYLVSWTLVDAAEGTFVARKKGDHWEFKLTMASCGAVNEIYPFTSYFWSILGPSPWRSVEYGEYRFEPRRIIKDRTQINYAGHMATRERWAEGKTRTFPIGEDAVDDVGTMLYHIRTGPWKPGDKRTLFVYADDSEKQANVECIDRVTRAFGPWPAQPLLHIRALPGKGTHHRGGLDLWMTDDARRLPLHADLDFRYGSFSIDLTKAAVAPLAP